MYCTKCGAENPDTGKFCSKCGNPLHQVNTVEETAGTVKPKNPKGK